MWMTIHLYTFINCSFFDVKPGLHLDHLGVGPQAHILNQRSPKDQSRGIDLGGAGCQNSAAFWVL